jgi:predicted methyltransferase
MPRYLLLVIPLLLMAACRQEAESPAEEAADTAAQASQAATEAQDTSVGATDPDANADIYTAAVNHPDRPAEDRERDLQRKPAQVMAFAGLQPGMMVLDVFTGGGWYAELLSRVVGEAGTVWAHNPPWYYERYGDAIMTARLVDERLPNVVRHDRPVDALDLPADTFDFAVAGMVFHDLHWMTEDVVGVLRQIHAALKPGGHFLITDHAAPEGTGAAFALEREGGMHRIEEAFAIAEMEEAGFELVDRSDLLRVPEDDRSQPFFQMQGAFTDRFVLLFRKPEAGVTAEDTN